MDEKQRLLKERLLNARESEQRWGRQERILREGARLAQTLVGLSAGDAESRILAAGFDPEMLAHTTEAVTADMRTRRIRCRLDESRRVLDASAG